MQVITLGRWNVDGGQARDPQRIAKMVNRPHRLGDKGLRSSNFPGRSCWKEGVRLYELAVADFPGEWFDGFSALQNRLREESELASWQFGDFPELMSEGVGQNLPTLWERGVWRVYATALTAIWMPSRRCITYVCCKPDERSTLDANNIEHEFVGGTDAFLLSREVGEERGS